MSSNVALDEVQPVKWTDLRGVDDVIRALEAKVALPFENDALAAQFGLKPKRGVLLAGPPGTGKTTIGRALAHRLKSKFFLIDGTVVAGSCDFFDEVKAIFEKARRNAPSIVFSHRAREIEVLLAGIEAVARIVVPQDVLSISSDEEDNRFLECAAECDADFLVTGNLRHFPEAIGRTRIVTPRDFLTTFRG